MSEPTPTAANTMRLDKWLWAARFFKTRTLASDEVSKGHVTVNGQSVKPAREVKPGDHISIRRPGIEQVFVVRGLSAHRGPAPVAQRLYEETQDSRDAALKAAQARRMGTEPALALEDGRPTKRNRRQLAAWQRWSASADDT